MCLKQVSMLLKSKLLGGFSSHIKGNGSRTYYYWHILSQHSILCIFDIAAILGLQFPPTSPYFDLYPSQIKVYYG